MRLFSFHGTVAHVRDAPFAGHGERKSLPSKNTIGSLQKFVVNASILFAVAVELSTKASELSEQIIRTLKVKRSNDDGIATKRDASRNVAARNKCKTHVGGSL